MTRTRGRRIGIETLTLDPISIPKSVKTERSKIQTSRNAEGEKEKQGRWLTSPLPSPPSCGKDRTAPVFVAEVQPRGYGYRAPTRSRLTAARSPDGERARRQEGPRWRRLRLLLRRGSLSLEMRRAAERERRTRKKGRGARQARSAPPLIGADGHHGCRRRRVRREREKGREGMN